VSRAQPSRAGRRATSSRSGGGRQPAGQPDATGDALSDRAQRTRSALVTAGRKVFERRGYHGARIADFTDECGMAVGTFYTYFASKRELLEAVLAVVEEEVWGVLALRSDPGDPPETRIRITNELTLESYRRNARFWAALEESSLADPEARALLVERRAYYRRRTEHAIRAWQAAGHVPADLDAAFAAMALGSMTERCAYLWYVVGEHVDDGAAARQLTDVWVASLRLDPTTGVGAAGQQRAARRIGQGRAVTRSA
jgi:AcrR family transcriptional regulator